jgi:putative DNA primase/helicase
METKSKITKEEIKEIEQEIAHGDKGLANIFYKYNKEILICTNVKSKVLFYFNRATKLYEEVGIETLNEHIATVLQSILEILMKHQAEMMNTLVDCDDDTLNLIKRSNLKRETTFKNLVQRVGTSKATKDIWDFILKKYYNKEYVGKFDNQQNVIPIRNGKVVDLISRRVIERTSEHLYTYELNYDYIGDNTPLTEKFIMELATGNKVKYNYLQLVLGSAITFDTSMKCFYIFHGKAGDNGKSTLMEIMAGNFTRISTTLTPHMLFNENKDKVSDADFYKLFGKTFAVASEPQERHVNAEVLKLLTGGDTITGKKLFCDKIDFLPAAKIFVLLNGVIYINDDSQQIMKRRTRVISFNSKFISNPTKPNEYKMDVDLKKKFTENEQYRNDLFSWLVNGAMLYFSKGNDRKSALEQPAELEHERQNYFDKMDFYNTFLKEHCVVDNDCYVERYTLWRAYEAYEHDNGRDLKANAKALFYSNIQKKFTLVNPKNVKKFKGLRLKTKAELEGEGEIQEKSKTVVDDRSELIQQLKQQQEENELYKLYINATRVIQKARRSIAFVESLVYESTTAYSCPAVRHNCNPLESEVSATNPMDVVTKTKNYEPDCSSKQKSFTQDGVLNIVF